MHNCVVLAMLLWIVRRITYYTFLRRRFSSTVQSMVVSRPALQTRWRAKAMVLLILGQLSSLLWS